MNPLKLSCHHDFFKSRIAFGQRRSRVITFCTFMPLVESSMISWLRRAASKRSCVTSIHAMPCRSIFPPAWRPKYRANRGPNRQTARPARQGRSRTAAGAKMLPVSPCRRTIRSDICSNRPQSARLSPPAR